MVDRIVLGLVGNIGSGKDFAAEYLIKRYDFKNIGMGDLVREATAREGLEMTRKNQQEVSRQFTNKYGQSYWAEKVADKVISSKLKRAIISGVRRAEEINVYTEKFSNHFRLILIKANPQIRFKRMKLRSRPGDPKTWEEFKTQEKNELKLYKTFNEATKLANYTVNNESKPKDLFLQLDAVMKKLGVNKSN